MPIRRPLHVPSADWTPRQTAIATVAFHRPDPIGRLERAARSHLGLEVLAFGSARAALAALLTVHPPASRTVVVPAYTCVAVPNAVAAARTAVRWVDIDGANLDIDEAIRLAGAGDAVLAQHTYGVEIPPAAMDRLRDAGLVVIEDRAHRFDGDGVAGDAAIFSLEHSKVVSAGLGGLIWVRDPDLLAELRAFRARLDPVPWWVARRALLTSVAQVSLDARWIPRAPSAVARRAALRFPPTSNPAQTADELAGGGVAIRAMHPDLAEVGIRGIVGAGANLAHRREIGAIYRDRLASLVPPWALADRPYVRQPIVADDAERVRLHLRSAGFELGPRWFEAPVHPSGSTSDYPPGRAPRAERLADTVLSLPTHPRLDRRTAGALADAITAAG